MFCLLSTISFKPVVPKNQEQQTSTTFFEELSSAAGQISNQTLNHNYMDCCSQNNVTAGCMSFCNLRNILDGTIEQDPEQCESDFPNIVKCMAGTILRVSFFAHLLVSI